MNTTRRTAKQFFTDKHGKLAIFQRPNFPIVGWAVTMIGARLIAAGPWHDWLFWLSSALLFTWAYLEITQGSSYFRRALGIVVVLYVIASRF